MRLYMNRTFCDICYTKLMNTFIKNSVLSIVALYALFAAIIGVMYVLNNVTQETLVDWLVKGGFIAMIAAALSVVVGFITNRGK